MRGLAHTGRRSLGRGASSPGRCRRGGRAASAALAAGIALSGLLGVAPAATAQSTVAILLSAPVKEYDEAVAGFEETFGGRVVLRESMNGDFKKADKILAKVESEVKPDLIYAVGVWALEAVLKRAGARPVVYSMVLNPESVAGISAHAGGASMNVSAEKAIDLLAQLGSKRVGVVYNEAKTGALVQRAGTVATARGITLVTRAVSNPGAAVPALNSLKGEGIDALWIVPDETVLAPTVMKHLLRFSYSNKIPTLGISERQAKMGTLMAVSFGSTRDIGRQAGEIGRAVLAGKSPERTTAREVTLTVNLKVARQLGVEIPQSLLVAASTVIE